MRVAVSRKLMISALPGLEYRGERLMPRLTRLPDVLDYPIRTHHAPRIIYDDGPRRDMDERMPPSRYPTFDER